MIWRICQKNELTLQTNINNKKKGSYKMEQKLLIYNTLTRTKERFTPLHEIGRAHV